MEIFKLGLREEPDPAVFVSLLPGRNKPMHGDVCDVPGPSSMGTKHLVERLTGPEFESRWGRCEIQTKTRPYSHSCSHRCAIICKHVKRNTLPINFL